MSKRKSKLPKTAGASIVGLKSGVTFSDAFFNFPKPIEERRVEKVTFDLRNRIPRNAVELHVDILLDEGVFSQVIRRA